MRRAPELWWALAAMAVITAAYLTFARATTPGALVGHGLGILGFVLMLATETLYSIRKRKRGRAFGPMRTWLRAHIFTGIVGSYMVLLHTSWQFGGLAGWTMLATIVVVVSGFVGRYLYAALPRTIDGDEATLAEVQSRLAEVEAAAGQATLGDAERRRQQAEHRRLQRQQRGLARVRRLLALWHLFHVPLGMVLFTLAFAHIAAAIYFTARLW